MTLEQNFKRKLKCYHFSSLACRRVPASFERRTHRSKRFRRSCARRRRSRRSKTCWSSSRRWRLETTTLSMPMSLRRRRRHQLTLASASFPQMLLPRTVTSSQTWDQFHKTFLPLKADLYFAEKWAGPFINRAWLHFFKWTTNGWREKDKKCTHETYIKMHICIENKTTSVNIKGCKDRQM